MPVKDVDTQLIAGRLEKVMKALGFDTAKDWATALGYKRPDNLYNALNGDRMPGVPLLIDISNMFEQVNISWVLTGNGQMLRNEQSGTGPDRDVSVSFSLKESEARLIAANLELLYSAFAKPADSDTESLVPGPVPSDNFALGKKKGRNQ